MLAHDGGGLLGAAGGGDPEIAVWRFAKGFAQGGAHGFGLGDAAAGEGGVRHVALHAGGGVEHGFGVAGENQIHLPFIGPFPRTSPLPPCAFVAIVPPSSPFRYRDQNEGHR